jgi:hypothetical protein
VAGCWLPLFNAVFCAKHAQRQIRLAPAAPVRPLHDQACVIDGCDQRARRGLCLEHRRRLNTGDPLLIEALVLACRGHPSRQRCACGRVGAIWVWDGTGRSIDLTRWLPVCAQCAPAGPP